MSDISSGQTRTGVDCHRVMNGAKDPSQEGSANRRVCMGLKRWVLFAGNAVDPYLEAIAGERL